MPAGRRSTCARAPSVTWAPPRRATRISRPTPAYWYASRRRYFLRNHGRATLWLANAVYIVGGLIRRARSFVLQRLSHEPRRHMRDFLRFNLRLGPQPDVHPPRPAALRATASTGVAPVRPECAR
ncbi:MAG: hypothetical protein R3E53_07480 [Myxococcota bacterium]